MLPGIKQETHDLRLIFARCRNVPGAMLRLRSPPSWPFPLSSAPSTHHAKVTKAHSPQPPFTRSLHSPRASPARSCSAPTSAGSFGFPDFSRICHLPAAPATQLVAVSHSSYHPDLSAAHGNGFAGTKSASNQLRANVGGRCALHYFFPLFSAASMRNTACSHPDSLLILQCGAVFS